MRRLRKFILWSILAMALIAGAIVVHAANPYDVPGVSLSPDGTGWTTNYGDKNYKFCHRSKYAAIHKTGTGRRRTLLSEDS